MADLPSCPWELLTSGLVERIASLLTPNEVACTLCLLNKSISKLLRAWKLVRLTEPVPHHAFVKRWGSEESTRDLTLKQRNQLLCLTARSGCIENLEVALAAVGCPLTEAVFTAAASAGHIEMCIWLLDHGCGCDAKKAIAAAASAGHLVVVLWILYRDSSRGHRLSLSSAALIAAASEGNRVLCEELLKKPGIKCSGMAAQVATENGHVDLTSWLLERLMAQYGSDKQFYYESAILLNAASGFPLPELQRLYYSRLDSEGALWQEFAENCGFLMAAFALSSCTPDWRAKFEWLEAVGYRLEGRPLASGPLAFQVMPDTWPDAVERVALLRERGFLSVRAALRDAVYRARLPVLRYLRSEGLLAAEQHDTEWMRLAAACGNVAIMVELLAAGWLIGEDILHSAASYGHLHVLQWMQGAEAGPVAAEALQRALQDPELTACSARAGSLELMVWLRERGCPWHEDSFTSAATSGNVALLEWMAVEGCPMPATGMPYLAAGGNDDFATLRCLRRLGCPWGPSDGTIFNRAVFHDRGRTCSPAVLRWLIAEGCPVDCEAAKKQSLVAI